MNKHLNENPSAEQEALANAAFDNIFGAESIKESLEKLDSKTDKVKAAEDTRHSTGDTLAA